MFWARIASVAATALTIWTGVSASPLTPTILAQLSRVGSPTVSPNGRWLVWEQDEPDLGANRAHSSLWRRDLTHSNAPAERFAVDRGTDDSAPEFGVDGWLYFLAHGEAGRAGVWRVDPLGGERERVTADEGIDGFRLSPRGDALLVWATRPSGSQALTAAVPLASAGRGNARIYDQLPVRFWKTWSDGQRSQLFVASLVNGRAATPFHPIEGSLIGDAPPRPSGGRDDVAWSPDGRTIYFTLREAGRIEPMSTNFDIFAAPADGSAPPTNVTRANAAIDTQPAVSPDGRLLAWLATSHPGYENDRQVVMLLDIATGSKRAVTANWDRSVDTIHWLPNSAALYVTAEDDMNHPLYRVQIADGRREQLTREGHVGEIAVLRSGSVIYGLDTITAPVDFWELGKGGHHIRRTAANADRLEGVTWPRAARFVFKGANGDLVQGMTLLPQAVHEHSVPTVLFVHGGPQNSFSNRWSYLANTTVLTGHGYGIVAVDFHGSTGHGQAFTDSIHEDWGGKPLVDLQMGLEAALAQTPQLDGSRVCAQGGSYGGYMMNWIEGKWPDRFRCLVQAAGPFDTRAMTYETDDLRADEWDFGDRPYHGNPDVFEKWSPIHAVSKWRTPMLVLAGERDYRTPVTQALAAFTALQQRSITSRLVVFPDEGHWTQKPRNSVQYYEEVLAWLDRFIGRRPRQRS